MEHAGWTMTAFFRSPELEVARVRESVGMADLSHFVKFDSKIRPPQHYWKLGENHYLAIGEPPLNSFPGAIDVTSVYASLRLAGPRSRDLLRKLTSLNVEDAALENLHCAQAELAHVHSIVLREDLPGMPAFHLLVTREYAESVWEATFHAGREFRLCPFGLAALQMLRA